MNLPDNLLPVGWSWTGQALCALLLIWAIRTAPWRKLKDTGPLNVWLGTCVVLMAWSEAVTTGMAITLMVVYSPLWLSTFDDARYLKRNK